MHQARLKVYLHQFSSNNCSVDLVFSKTRLAPQGITTPRLKLLGVLIGTRAMRFVEKELHLPISFKILWSDSQCVLQWLKGKKPLSAFVTNRLKEIKSLEGTLFKYIPTQENPADPATRGKSPSEIMQSICIMVSKATKPMARAQYSWSWFSSYQKWRKKLFLKLNWLSERILQILLHTTTQQLISQMLTLTAFYHYKNCYEIQHGFCVMPAKQINNGPIAATEIKKS